MAAPAQTFWEGLRRGHRTHVSLSQGRAVVTSNHHLSPCSPTSPWGKSKRCHLRLMRTINPCPTGWRSSRQVSIENLGYFRETPQCLHWVTPWIAAGRGKWGFIPAAHMVSPCSIGRGEVEEVISTHHPPSLSPVSSSRLQAAPVSQSPCWGRAGLWLRVVIMEGFKLWQMMKMEKVELEMERRNRADSLADVWCCISRWPMPGFSGKGLYYGNSIPVFPLRPVAFGLGFFLIYWILHERAFLIYTKVLSLLRLMSCASKDWK